MSNDVSFKIHSPQALKLHMALQAALVQMSRYKFSTKQGKRAAITIAVHLDQDRLSLHESSTKA